MNVSTPIRAVVFCNDTWHPVEVFRDGFTAAAADLATIAWLETPAAWRSPRLARDNIAVLLKGNTTSPTDRSPWLTPEVERVLSEHVRSGGGMLIIHAGTAGYRDHAELLTLTGGAFKQHPPPCAVRITPVGEHPVNAGVVPFTAEDEHYEMTIAEEARAAVFLESRSEHGVQPAGWTCERAGEGRVCVVTPGHTEVVWRHASFQRLVRNALGWVARRA